MYKFIPFESIDKNKWNGAIHYALNGNIFGYHWYLKAVVKEWDAIIEDDYESVLPIIRAPLYEEQYKVLPFLGPYSVNYMNQSRFNALLDPATKKINSALYPLNQHTTVNIAESIPSSKSQYWILETQNQYEAIKKEYAPDVLQFLNEEGLHDSKLSAGVKPEKIVATRNDSSVLKNTYLRIMYNAMHRGIGFSNAVFDIKSDRIKAVSFYIISHNSFFELFHFAENEMYRYLLLDILIQNQAGKPMKIFSFDPNNADTKLGFEKKSAYNYQLDNSIVNRIRKKFRMTY
jgi:hypothetical protein